MTEASVGSTWKDPAKVGEYLERIGRLEARAEGERELLAALPDRVEHVVDLGAGDGRLAALVLAKHADAHATVLDNSPPMLALARERFAGDGRVRVVEHDLAEPMPAPPLLPDEGCDVVVSGFAIHHLSHERKRTLFGEIARLLRPGGVFANLEVVQCATPAVHEEFNRRIGRPGGDPQDVLAPVEEQLGWMRDAGLVDVDCRWRWLGFALLAGRTRDGR